MKENQEPDLPEAPDSPSNNPVIKDDEIDLIELAKVIWSKRRFIIKVTSIFLVLGLIIAFTSKVEYEASCKLLPESQEGGMDLGGLGGLAGLAGFDIGGIDGSSGVLTPELYPEIVQSTPFLDKLINTPVYFEKLDTTISSFSYFKELDSPSLFGYIIGYTIGLPKMLSEKQEVMDSKESSNINRYSKEEWGLIKSYADRLSVSVDASTGIISVETELPDPVAAAQVTIYLVDGLTKKVIDYKIEKAKFNLDFVEERFSESEKEYKNKQEQLARFSDRNRNITTSMIQNEYERLQNELNIAFEVYKGLASQLEQAKIKVKEETPVFTVLEPVKIPIERSNTRKVFVVIISILAGFISSLIVIGVTYIFHKLRIEMNEDRY